MMTPVPTGPMPAHTPSRRRSPAVFLLIALVASAVQGAHAGSLSSIAPAGASAGQQIDITGPGFDPAASNNVVTFASPVGAAIDASVTAVATLDERAGLRRV